MENRPNLIILLEDCTEKSTLKKLLQNPVLELNFQECLKCAKNLHKTFGDIGLKIVYDDTGFTGEFYWQEKPLGTITVKVFENNSVNAINKFAGPTIGSSGFSAGLLYCKLLVEIKPLVAEEVARYANLYSRAGGQDLKDNLEKLRAMSEKFTSALDEVLSPNA